MQQAGGADMVRPSSLNQVFAQGVVTTMARVIYAGVVSAGSEARSAGPMTT